MSYLEDRWDRRMANFSASRPDLSPTPKQVGPASSAARTFHFFGGLALGALWLFMGLCLLLFCVSLIGIVIAWVFLTPWALVGAAAFRSFTIATTGLPPSKLAYEAGLREEVLRERAGEQRQMDMDRMRREMGTDGSST